MANVLLRSPFYEYRTRALALSAKLELSINGNLEYTILKDTISNGVLFELSELADDFLEIQYSGTYAHQGIVFSGVVTYYDGFNGAGNEIGLPENFSHIGLEGYSTFKEGKQLQRTGRYFDATKYNGIFSREYFWIYSLYEWRTNYLPIIWSN